MPPPHIQNINLELNKYLLHMKSMDPWHVMQQLHHANKDKITLT